MRLRRLDVRRMPGIDEPFAVDDVADGLLVVVGPNGSGKTTVATALRALLWPDTVETDGVDVAATWEIDGTEWTATRDGRAVQWRRDGAPAEPPPLPDASVAHCFFPGLRDLLAEHGASDVALAREVRTRLAGGYDPRAVAETLFPEGTWSRRGETRRLREAEKAAAEVARAQRVLLEREATLGGLEERLAAARTRAAELGGLRYARDLAVARDDLREVEDALAAMPAGLDRFRGDEKKRLADRKGAVEALERERAEVRARADEAAAAADATRLPGGPIDEAALATWNERALTLRERESERSRARDAAARADAARRAAAAALAGEAAGDGDVPPLDHAILDALDAHLARAERVRAERASWTTERDRLAARAAGPDDAPSADALAGAVEDLDAWLAEAERPRRPVLGRVGLSLSAAAIAVGAALGLLLHPIGWTLAGVGVGAVLAAALDRGARDGVRRLAELRARWDARGLDDPTTWTPDDVRARRQALATARAETADRARAAAVLEESEGRRAELDAAEAGLAGSWRELAATAGLDPRTPALSGAVLARALAELRAATREAAEAEATVRRLDAEIAEDLASISGWLEARGEATGPIADATEARKRVEALAARSRTRRDADRDRAGAERELSRLDERLAAARADLAAFWRDLGRDAPDEGWLARMLPAAEEWRALEGRRRDRAVAVAQAGSRPELRDDLVSPDVATAMRRIEAAEAAEEEANALRDEIADIRREVDATRRGSRLEDALAARDEARRALADVRGAALRTAAGRFLLDGVRAQYDRDRLPAVVRRAAALFDRFTRHEWSFDLDPDADPPAFRAREGASGEVRSLSELSDGTRVQLLLAVRLAFAGAAETGAAARVPLVLDEVLTTTDPARFAAVAAALAAVVRDEARQVLYLSANPADAAAWDRRLADEGLPPAGRVDLAAVRGRGRTIDSPEALAVPALPVPPPPGDDPPDRYGARLGVRAFDPRRPAGEIDLFHLLRDDLPLVHRLRTAGLRTVGQWRNAVAADVAERLVGAEAVARVAARVRAAEGFASVRSVGRGRPVDGAALRAADVSDTMLPRVLEVARAVRGDARALLDAIDAKEVKNFRSDKRDALAAFLEEEGYLDPRAPLDEDAVRTRVLAVAEPDLSGGTLTAADVAALVHVLWTQAERAEDPAASPDPAPSG